MQSEEITITWARLKWEREAVELRDCESRLRTLMEGADVGFGFWTVETKEEVLL